MTHADLVGAVHPEQDARLAQQPFGHPEVLEVVHREAGALVEHQVADALAEAGGPGQRGAREGHHRAVLLVERRLLVAAPLAGEQRHQPAALVPPVEGAVLGHRDHAVETALHQALDRRVDGGRLAEGSGGLQHHHQVGALALALDHLDRVGDDRLEAGDVAGQLGRAQEGRLGPVGAGHVGHARVVGGDHQPVHQPGGAGRLEGVGQQRPVAQALDVEVRDAVGPAPGRHHGQHPPAVDHRRLRAAFFTGVTLPRAPDRPGTAFPSRRRIVAAA